MRVAGLHQGALCRLPWPGYAHVDGNPSLGVVKPTWYLLETGCGLQAAQMQDLAHNRAGPAGAASAASQSAQAAKWAHLIVQRFVALTQINQVCLHWLCHPAAS